MYYLHLLYLAKQIFSSGITRRCAESSARFTGLDRCCMPHSRLEMSGARVCPTVSPVPGRACQPEAKIRLEHSAIPRDSGAPVSAKGCPLPKLAISLKNQ